MSAELLDRYSKLARNFAVDALTAEVASAFACEGIQTLVLKGPVLASWLYPGEVRTYCDSDLLVAIKDHEHAVCVLGRLGFVEHHPWLATPLSLDIGRTTFTRRDGGVVDLHCQLPGLEGDPEAVWEQMAASSDRQAIGGAELRVPDRDTVLLHVVLHAAQHANLKDGKPLEDLRRALTCVEGQRWSRALELARAYGGVPAFAAGLRLLPEGARLASGLGLDEVRSLQYTLRGEDVIAEQLYALLSADEGFKWKLGVAASRIFPRPDHVRWWSPLARRGKRGLAGAYVWRAIWTIGQAVGAARTLWRIPASERRIVGFMRRSDAFSIGRLPRQQCAGGLCSVAAISFENHGVACGASHGCEHLLRTRACGNRVLEQLDGTLSSGAGTRCEGGSGAIGGERDQGSGQRSIAGSAAEALDRLLIRCAGVVDAHRQWLGVGVNEAIGVEHGVLVRPVFCARPYERRHERGLARETPTRKHDRALPYPDDSCVDENMVGGVQCDVHAQLGVENAERESQVKRTGDWFLIAHDVEKPLVCGVLDEREAALLGWASDRTGMWRQEVRNSREVLRIGADRHGHAKSLDCYRFCGALIRHMRDSSTCFH